MSDRGSTVPAPASTVPESVRLERALRELGLAAQVEAREGLAIVILSPESPTLDATLRRACVREAQLAGFTHVALEIAR